MLNPSVRRLRCSLHRPPPIPVRSVLPFQPWGRRGRAPLASARAGLAPRRRFAGRPGARWRGPRNRPRTSPPPDQSSFGARPTYQCPCRGLERSRPPARCHRPLHPHLIDPITGRPGLAGPRPPPPSQRCRARNGDPILPGGPHVFKGSVAQKVSAMVCHVIGAAPRMCPCPVARHPGGGRDTEPQFGRNGLPEHAQGNGTEPAWALAGRGPAGSRHGAAPLGRQGSLPSRRAQAKRRRVP